MSNQGDEGVMKSLVVVMSRVRGHRSVHCLASMLVVLILSATAGVTGYANAASEEPELPVTGAVRATEFNVDPGRSYTAPSLAVDPEDPRNVVASTFEARSNRCGLIRSRDAGRTWAALDASPSPSFHPFCLMTNAVTQGQLAFGRGHMLYYAFGGWGPQDGVESRSVFLARSSDFGETWATSPVSDPRGRTGEDALVEKPVTGLAVDTVSADQDIVYVGWRREFPGLEIARNPMVAVSSDGGQTFSEPVNAIAGFFDGEEAKARALEAVEEPFESEPVESEKSVNFGGVNSKIAVDEDGTLYVLWVAVTANIEPSPPVAHFLSRSTDRGKTFTVTEVNGFSGNVADNFEAQLAWSPGGGSQGSLHVVYEGTTEPVVSGVNDIFYRRSTDEGETWTEPTILNDDDPERFFVNAIPDVSVAPSGRLDVVWWDTRAAADSSGNDVYYTTSSDDGATWSENLRVSEQSVDRKIGTFAQNFDLFAPPGVVSTDAFTMVGWDDTRNGNAQTQTQDIYTAAVQHQPLPPVTSNSLRFLIAGLVGLVAAGLLFVLGWLFYASGRKKRPAE